MVFVVLWFPGYCVYSRCASGFDLCTWCSGVCFVLLDELFWVVILI